MGAGHANKRADWCSAQAHYDAGPGAVQVCDVSVGEDDIGIWCAGALRPTITEPQLREFLALSPSGDWRAIVAYPEPELIAVAQVVAPAVPRSLARRCGHPRGPYRVRSTSCVPQGGRVVLARRCGTSLLRPRHRRMARAQQAPGSAGVELRAATSAHAGAARRAGWRVTPLEGAAEEASTPAGDTTEAQGGDGADGHDVGQAEAEAAPTISALAVPVSPVATTYDFELWAAEGPDGQPIVLVGFVWHTPVGSSTYFVAPDVAERMADELKHHARTARHKQREALSVIRHDVLSIVQGNGKRLIVPPS